jgi:hypothetical protein
MKSWFNGTTNQYEQVSDVFWAMQFLSNITFNTGYRHGVEDSRACTVNERYNIALTQHETEAKQWDEAIAIMNGVKSND